MLLSGRDTAGVKCSVLNTSPWPLSEAGFPNPEASELIVRPWRLPQLVFSWVLGLSIHVQCSDEYNVPTAGNTNLSLLITSANLEFDHCKPNQNFKTSKVTCKVFCWIWERNNCIPHSIHSSFLGILNAYNGNLLNTARQTNQALDKRLSVRQGYYPWHG